jgi:hypothetical protein
MYTAAFFAEITARVSAIAAEDLLRELRDLEVRIDALRDMEEWEEAADLEFEASLILDAYHSLPGCNR